MPIAQLTALYWQVYKLYSAVD